MFTIRECAIVCIDRGNKILDDDITKTIPERNHPTRSTTTLRRRSLLCWWSWCTLTCSRSLSLTLTRSTSASTAWYTRSDTSIFHYNNHRLGFAFCNQVIHDEICTALICPCPAVLAHTMLQVKYRVFLFCFLIIAGWSVNIGKPIFSSGLG